MTLILSAILFAVLHVLRGRDIIDNIVFYAIATAIAFFVVVPTEVGLAMIIAGYAILLIGLLLVFAFGLGKYFMVIHGLDKRNEKEFLPADATLDSIEKYHPLSNYWYGGIGMFIRFALPSMPIFLLSSSSVAEMLAKSIIFGVTAACGYAACRLDKTGSTLIAEAVVGFVFVILLGV